MTDKFDFDKVGKRIPYSIPSGFIDKLEENVIAEVTKINRKKRLRRMIFGGSLFGGAAVAASVVVLLTPSSAVPTAEPVKVVHDDLLTQVDIAYENLSANDRDFLIDIYSDDIFLTQQP